MIIWFWIESKDARGRYPSSYHNWMHERARNHTWSCELDLWHIHVHSFHSPPMLNIIPRRSMACVWENFGHHIVTTSVRWPSEVIISLHSTGAGKWKTSGRTIYETILSLSVLVFMFDPPPNTHTGLIFSPSAVILFDMRKKDVL